MILCAGGRRGPRVLGRPHGRHAAAPEATLAVANLLWVLMASVGGLLFHREGLWGQVMEFLPPGALGTALRASVVDGAIAWPSLGILVVSGGARQPWPRGAGSPSTETRWFAAELRSAVPPPAPEAHLPQRSQ